MKSKAAIYLNGLIAGIIGAAVIAIWFLFLDTVRGLPFYAPTVLGTGLFQGAEDLASTERVQVSLQLTLMYTWVHALVFIVLGEIAAFALSAAMNPNPWLLSLLLFAILELGFIGTTSALARPVFDELTWPAVLVGNLLAAAGMSIFLWLRRANPRGVTRAEQPG